MELQRSFVLLLSAWAALLVSQAGCHAGPPESCSAAGERCVAGTAAADDAPGGVPLKEEVPSTGDPREAGFDEPQWPHGEWFERQQLLEMELKDDEFQSPAEAYDIPFVPTSHWADGSPVNDRAAATGARGADGARLHRRRRSAKKTDDCALHVSAQSSVADMACQLEANRDALEDPDSPTFFPVPREVGDAEVCYVHACNATTAHLRSSDPESPMFGHLLPFGEQGQAVDPVDEVGCLDPETFLRSYLLKFKPVLMRGCAVDQMLAPGSDGGPLEWTDAHLRRQAQRPKAYPDESDWSHSVVEMQLEVISNERGPFLFETENATAPFSVFGAFMDRYRDEPLYFINQVTTDLLREVPLPAPVQCRGLFSNEEQPLIWMNGGRSASSQHFDTHDQLFMQVDGSKRVVLVSPAYSRNLYMDHHSKFGLSPLNVKKVDLRRFPQSRNARIMNITLQKGDILFVPTHWWHVNFNPGGRNLMVNQAVHIELRQAWARYGHPTGGSTGGKLEAWARRRSEAPEASPKHIAEACRFPGGLQGLLDGGRRVTLGDLARVRAEAIQPVERLMTLQRHGQRMYNGYASVHVANAEDWLERWLQPLVSLVPGPEDELGRLFRYVWGRQSFAIVFESTETGYVVDLRREPLRLRILSGRACAKLEQAHFKKRPHAPEFTAVFREPANLWRVLVAGQRKGMAVARLLRRGELFFYGRGPRRRLEPPTALGGFHVSRFEHMLFGIVKTVATWRRSGARPASAWRQPPREDRYLAGVARE